MRVNLLTITSEKLHLTNCKLEISTGLVHQHLPCVEAEINADIPATCWFSTWWHCSHFCKSIACSWSIPDVIVIWYSTEYQFGKTSDTVTIVVQYNGCLLYTSDAADE